LYLKEVTFAIDHADESGNIILSRSLESYKADLEALRKTFPTSKEILVEIEELKLKLDAAKAKKLFKTCRELNESINALSEKMNAVLSTEDTAALMPLHEMVERRETLENSIAVAMEIRDSRFIYSYCAEVFEQHFLFWFCKCGCGARRWLETTRAVCEKLYQSLSRSNQRLQKIYSVEARR
jgi:hypothetical protein